MFLSKFLSNEDVYGGGCVLALRRDISAVRINEWEKEIPFDNVWLKLNTTGNSKIFINTIYLPGWASFEHVSLYFDQLFDIINSREPYSRFIILGDFNLSCIEWFPQGDNSSPILFEGRQANELINTMTATNLKQFNLIKNKYNKILDLVLSNVGVAVSRANYIVNKDNYHPSIIVEFNRSNIKFLNAHKTCKLNFFRTNYPELMNELSNIDWENELAYTNADQASDKFYSIFNPLISKYTPMIKPKSDEFPKWYSLKLINMIKDKEVYRKHMNNSNDERFARLFKLKRKEIKREQRKCLKLYENNVESLITSNTKSFFAYTKAFNQSNRLPPAMIYKGKVSENLTETANLFANHFSSVYSLHNNNFDIDGTINANTYFELSTDEIENVIKKMDESKTNSPDNIPIKFYKSTVEVIKKPLLILFNLVARTMIYSTDWKKAFIFPIFKTGDNNNVENYRPISILPAISKIFDEILYTHILTRINHLLAPQQHGFTAGKSTLSN